MVSMAFRISVRENATIPGHLDRGWGDCVEVNEVRREVGNVVEVTIVGDRRAIIDFVNEVRYQCVG